MTLTDDEVDARLSGARVVVVHDYLTQRGGAERVVLALAAAFPGAPVVTSLYDPAGTFPEFAELDVRTTWLQRLPGLARHHRAALPLLAPTFQRLQVDADLVVCSSSGWAHGVQTSGRKLVYCYNPARWLYQLDEYTPGLAPGTRRLLRGGLAPLRSWDRRRAATADRYLGISSVVAERIRAVYGVDPQVVHPPTVLPGGTAEPAPQGVPDDYLLVVSRARRYKNVELVASLVEATPGAVLVVVGGEQQRVSASGRVIELGRVSDQELRSLYAHASGLVALAYEDFGLTPVEAASYGVPVLALRAGGYLDTVVEGVTGVFVDDLSLPSFQGGVERLHSTRFEPATIRAHADRFSVARFHQAVRRHAAEVLAG